MSKEKPTDTRRVADAHDAVEEASVGTVRLCNGLYFAKCTKSDEKLVFTEHDMRSVVRTVLFVHVFRRVPHQSVRDIIYGGTVTYLPPSSLTPPPELDIKRVADIVDSVLGERFSTVVARPLTAVYSEYKYVWRYHAYGQPVALPSALDYVRLYRFVNAPDHGLSEATRFILYNGDDHKVPLQGRVKRLR